jgi:hypothetical protein
VRILGAKVNKVRILGAKVNTAEMPTGLVLIIRA